LTVKAHHKALSQGDVYRNDSPSALVEYSRQVMARRGIDLGERIGRYYDKSKGVEWSASGLEPIRHVLPDHVFGWSPRLERVDVEPDGSEREYHFIRGEWVDVTRLRLVAATARMLVAAE
jgi:hypothetical protein